MPHNVALVAVAKDEAAYVHEFVFHHLYFGFSDILVGVNRTTDPTREILAKIRSAYPQVRVYDVDWIDQGVYVKKNPNLQELAYAFLCDTVRREHPEVTHVLPIDIDEFWFPRDFEQSISAQLDALPAFDICSYNWLAQHGDEQAFEPPFENTRVRPARIMKSVIDVSVIGEVDAFGCHFPNMKSRFSPVAHIDSNGREMAFMEGKDWSLAYPDLERSDGFVLHRLMRSAREYTALLSRNTPRRDIPIKHNRPGFTKEAEQTLRLPSRRLDAYWRSLAAFSEECGISDLLDASRAAVLETSKRILDVDAAILLEHLVDYVRALRGTEYLAELLPLVRTEATALQPQHAGKYCECARLLRRSNDTALALQFLDAALACEPTHAGSLELREQLERN